MPNWVTNTITGDPDAIKAILDLMQSDKQSFDFNALITMPEELNITSGSSNDTDMYYYLSEKLTLSLEEVAKKPEAKLINNMFSKHEEWLTRIKDEVKKKLDRQEEPSYEMGKRLVTNYNTYGATTWYDWSNKNWGCKWNACDIYTDENTIEFDTPWDVPWPVMEKLCEVLPNIEFTFTATNEEPSIMTAENMDGVFQITEGWTLDEEYFEEEEFEL